MTADIAIVLAVLVGAVVLFAFERIPLEVTSLTIVVALAVTRVLSPEQALSGFSNDIVIFEFTLLAMTQGLASTGVIQLVGQRLASLGRLGENTLRVGLMAVVVAVSSVVSNTVTTAAFLPVAIAAADRAKVPRGKLLMPVAYAALLGGTITLVGTSTNLVVSSLLQRARMPPLGFAELTPLALPFAVGGIAVVALLARWLLPARGGSEEDEDLATRQYLSEVVVRGRRYGGRPLSALTQSLGLRVLAIARDGARVEPQPEVSLADGDVLVLEEDRLGILRTLDVRGLEMRPDAERPGATGPDPDAVLVEAAIPVGSSLVGRTLGEPGLTDDFGVVPLAVSRRPAIQKLTRMQLLGGLFGAPSLAAVPLAVGDILLVRATRDRIRALADGKTLTLMRHVEYHRTRHGKAALSVVIFLAVLVAAATRAVPYAVLGLCGMLAMIATRCVDARVAFRVDWRVALLIACMLPLGTAMDVTGAGRYLGSVLLPVAHHLGPIGVLVVLMLVTVVLSAPMSNQAAAAVILPIAFGIADQLRVNPRSFAIGICFAASCSFMTPLEPSCVLVYGPGRYRFLDFVKLGAPLTLVLFVLLAIFIPLRWPF